MTDLQVVSLFSGIEGIGLGCEQAGMTVRVCVEIDPVCRAVLRRHFPDAIILDDIRKVTGEQLRALGVDPARCVLTFGWPCQDLSIAGRRTGLDGTRSGLFWEAMRVAGELSPRWFVAENVPGLLSAVCTCPGDQTCIRAGRARVCGRWDTKRVGGRKHRVFAPHVVHGVPGGACPGGCMARHGGAMGTVVGAMGELGYGVAYRVLDAQFTGVPQRRRRVFFVGCFGNWGAPAQVLLEPESVHGGVAAGTQAGARVAGTLAASAGSGGLGGLGRGDLSADRITSRLVEDVASTIQGGGRRGHRVDAEGACGGHLIAVDLAQVTHGDNRVNPQPGDPAPSLNGSGMVHVAGTLRSHPRPGSNSDGAIVQPFALRGRDGNQPELGEPGSPSFALRTPGGGSSYPMVAVENQRGEVRASAISPALGTGTGKVGGGRPMVASTIFGGDTTHALTSEGGDASEDGTGSGTPIIAHPVTASMARPDGTVETTPHTDDDGEWLVTTFATEHRIEAKTTGIAEPITGSKGQPGGVGIGTAIRRLTPLECERLQGFPSGWTAVDDKGNPISDAARYRMIGNAVATTVARWIARRIVAYDLNELESR